jgi:transcriptional regulator GlxA family with amidase domain
MFQIPKNHGDEQIAHLQEWLETNFNNTISLDKLASIASLGKKSLARRFKKRDGRYTVNLCPEVAGGKREKTFGVKESFIQ